MASKKRKPQQKRPVKTDGNPSKPTNPRVSRNRRKPAIRTAIAYLKQLLRESKPKRAKRAKASAKKKAAVKAPKKRKSKTEAARDWLRGLVRSQERKDKELKQAKAEAKRAKAQAQRAKAEVKKTKVEVKKTRERAKAKAKQAQRAKAEVKKTKAETREKVRKAKRRTKERNKEVSRLRRFKKRAIDLIGDRSRFIMIDKLPNKRKHETEEEYAKRLIEAVLRERFYTVEEAYKKIAEKSNQDPRFVYSMTVSPDVYGIKVA